MINIGTSGFSFPDWIGTIYPKSIKKENMLSYYEKELGFKTLEINFTYYTLPSQKALQGMNNKTGADFKFVIKAFKGLTHDIWNERKEIIDNKKIFDKFIYSIDPLVKDSKLSCIIAQFPYSFHHTEGNLEYLKFFKDRFGEIPVIIEFRNSDWVTDNTFTFLKNMRMGYCIVDEPGLKNLMPYYPAVTSDIAYFRFHGRNKNWFSVPASERYNYLYSEQELNEFLPGIIKISGKSKTTFVFFNNCHAGSAAKNAITLAKMIGQKNSKI
ncbi:DUF72 domain-containing protein [Candidatus Desantisbacteria bacterium]|nr:DUF72 domain-containing protein [Candidatus Desantisbacteria bacterium]